MTHTMPDRGNFRGELKRWGNKSRWTKSHVGIGELKRSEWSGGRGARSQKYSGWMSADARDSRRIKAATDKFLKRAGKKHGRSRRRGRRVSSSSSSSSSWRGRIVARWLVTPRSISLPRRLHARRGYTCTPGTTRVRRAADKQIH